MTKFTNTELDIDVEIVELTQRQAVPYWNSLQESSEASGPAQWQAILESAVGAKWFVDKVDPLNYTPAQARWLAEALAVHLLEASQIPNE